MAGGYRLAGEELEQVCCRHLYGPDRMLTGWPAEDHVIVVLVAPHDRTGSDGNALRLDALAVDLPADERAKPPCCDDAGQPPTDEAAAPAMVEAVGRAERRGRRVR